MELCMKTASRPPPVATVRRVVAGFRSRFKPRKLPVASFRRRCLSPSETENQKVCFDPLWQKRRAVLSLKAGEWLNVAFPHNQGFKDDSDAALQQALNEICNMTVTALLKEDEGEILDVQDELYSLGAFFSEQGNKKAAMLMYVLFKFCMHEIPKEVDTLEGLYKDAFVKIGGMLEDSGWELKFEGRTEDASLEADADVV